MEKALEFLKSHKDVAFATVEDGKPKIRVFQIMRQEGSTLFFTTAPGKEVYKQLRTTPDIEILGMAGNIFVRAAGKATFDVDNHTAQAIYDSEPVLQRLYKKYDDLVYFKLPIATLDYYDLTPTPPLQEHHEYGQD